MKFILPLSYQRIILGHQLILKATCGKGWSLLSLIIIQQIKSQALSHVIAAEEFKQLAKLQESEVRLFQCFLGTQPMVCRPEHPNTLRPNEEILELAPDGEFRRRQPQDRNEMVDPLYSLFNYPEQIGWLIIDDVQD